MSGNFGTFSLAKNVTKGKRGSGYYLFKGSMLGILSKGGRGVAGSKIP